MRGMLPAVFLALVATGCSSATKKLSNTALGLGMAFPQTHGVAARAKEYLAIAEKLKKFHDSGTLDEGDVLSVLKAGGVLHPGVPVHGVPGKPGAPTSAPKGVSQVPPPVAEYGGQYRWPLDAGVVSSEFGGRWGKQHKGIDLAAHLGEPVHASAEGVVLYAGSGMRGYGNALIVRHDEKFTTLYAHNRKLLVKQGDHVGQGQQIAELGSTGHSTGPHVHFEVREGEVALNPRERLVKGSF